MNSHIGDKIERWLVHENYRFKSVKSSENNFHFILKNFGSYNIPIEVFEPKKQAGVIVLGGKIFLPNKQTARYIKLSESEQQKFKDSLKMFCNSIRAIHKIFREDGKVVVGVYLVLDNAEVLSQELLMTSINHILEMSEKTNRYILKTF